MQERIRDEEAREVSLAPDPLSEALGMERYQRSPERRGFQHSPRERTITTGLGQVTVTVPRGRLFAPEGGSEEWRSRLLPRYA